MARTAPAYCALADLLIGDLPLGSSIDPEKWIDDAADEIDATIGTIYDLPIPFANLENVSQLILKITNARLASGRLLLASAQGAEDQSLHSYGRYLIDEAMTALESIKSGLMVLVTEDGTYGPTVDSDDFDGPSVVNKDAESVVDAFYDDFDVAGFFAPSGGLNRWLA